MSKEEIVVLKEDFSESYLYSEDLAPVAPENRTWSMWHLAALWVGMAVCIPTYLLASYMIGDGMSWLESLIIIGLANLIITIPMVLNGHAGVKYGVPFPVIGRSSFGLFGIHIPSIVRALVACGWFGIQTWIGGLAFYAIFCALTGTTPETGYHIGKFIGFGVFWLLNIYFIVKGTESIKFLEQYAAPILIIMGIGLITWGAIQTGGFMKVLNQSEQLVKPAAEIITKNGSRFLNLNPIKDKDNKIKADDLRIDINGKKGSWNPINNLSIPIAKEIKDIKIKFRKSLSNGFIESSLISPKDRSIIKSGLGSKMWKYILWLTIMLGFWATMSLSIADITRYASSQKAQIMGQFIGLPGTMMLYSFVGIFVTVAAVINFEDVLISNDAPWDPVSLLGKFNNPLVVILAQIFMIIATLSTNIAANVIAPANAFSNLYPKKISFKAGGIITGIIGIIICPWYLMAEISNYLIIISGLLGPVLGIMLADYFVVRKTNIDLAELYKENGKFKYQSGFNLKAMIALLAGVLVAVIGNYIPALEALYKLSWFSGFIVSFILYIVLMKNEKNNL